MGLAERIQENNWRYRPVCTVARLIADLPDDDRVALSDALADPGILLSAIERALRADGYEIAAQTLGRHRRGDCRCESR